jgi:hypothetical protein
MSKPRQRGKFRHLERPRGTITLANGAVFRQQDDLVYDEQAEIIPVWLDGRWQPGVAEIKRVPIGDGDASWWEGRWPPGHGRIRIVADHVQERRSGYRLLHLLINTRFLDGGRAPTTDELRIIRDGFYPPDVSVIHVFPSHDQYINVAEHCWHLWQFPGVWDNEHL